MIKKTDAQNCIAASHKNDENLKNFSQNDNGKKKKTKCIFHMVIKNVFSARY